MVHLIGAQQSPEPSGCSCSECTSLFCSTSQQQGRKIALRALSNGVFKTLLKLPFASVKNSWCVKQTRQGAAWEPHGASFESPVSRESPLCIGRGWQGSASLCSRQALAPYLVGKQGHRAEGKPGLVGSPQPSLLCVCCYLWSPSWWALMPFLCPPVVTPLGMALWTMASSMTESIKAAG